MTRVIILIVMLLTLAVLVSYDFTSGQFHTSRDVGKSVQIIVNADERYQTIDGFGSSQRVWKDRHLSNPGFIGPTPDVPTTIQDKLLDDLYAKLGLTRVRLGVGHNTEPVKGKFVFDCDASEGCGVDARISYVRQARPYGLTTILVENNPMSWMDGSNPEDHAENTLALLLHWRSTGGEPQYQILMNEPSGSGKPWADAAWHLKVVKALGPRMRAAGLKTMLVIPDDLNACKAYPIAKTTLEDPGARKYVGAIAYHLYGGRPGCQRSMRALSEQYHVPVWMTEHTRAPGYESSLEWAKEIHTLIADYGVSAVDILFGFFGDWVVKRGTEEDLIQITFGPDARYVSHRRTSKYYITGQFSRFVRPGYVRVGASSTNHTILTTSYRGDKRLVIVMINDNSREQVVDLSIKGVPVPRSFSVVRTSRSDAWESLEPIVPTESRFRLTLPAQSIVTLVGAIE